MLHTGHDGIVLCKICALVTSYHCPGDLRTQVRIFTAAFGNTSPAWVTGNIYHRGECPANPICTGLGCCYSCRFFNCFHIPGTSQTQWNRESGLITMDHIHSENEGDL